jgi:hypothetical protein
MGHHGAQSLRFQEGTGIHKRKRLAMGWKLNAYTGKVFGARHIAHDVVHEGDSRISEAEVYCIQMEGAFV